MLSAAKMFSELVRMMARVSLVDTLPAATVVAALVTIVSDAVGVFVVNGPGMNRCPNAVAAHKNSERIASLIGIFLGLTAVLIPLLIVHAPQPEIEEGDRLLIVECPHQRVVGHHDGHIRISVSGGNHLRHACSTTGY